MKEGAKIETEKQKNENAFPSVQFTQTSARGQTSHSPLFRGKKKKKKLNIDYCAIVR